MSNVASVRRLTDHPLGRLGIILLGVVLIYGLLTQYPPVRPVFRWAFSLLLVLWGGPRLFVSGMGDPLTVIAGCLLVLGGVSITMFRLLTMSETSGAVANLVLFIGIIAEMYAHHYRERDG